MAEQAVGEKTPRRRRRKRSTMRSSETFVHFQELFQPMEEYVLSILEENAKLRAEIESLRQKLEEKEQILKPLASYFKG